MSSSRQGVKAAGPILTEPEARSAAPYLSVDELRALAAPAEHLVLAAATAGRLLRSGDGRTAGRQGVLQWLAALGEADLAVVGGSTEQSAIEALSMLQRFATSSPDAQGLLSTAGRDSFDTAGAGPGGEGAVVASTPPLASGWLDQAIDVRDDAESLLVVLGTVALEHPSDAAGDAAAVWERRSRRLCEGVDRLASMLVPLLGDALQSTQGSAWLARIERREPSPWWLSLRRSKALGASQSQTSSSTATPRVAPRSNVITVDFRRPEAQARRAAHGGGDEPPVSASAGAPHDHHGLRFQIEEQDTEEGGSQVVLRIYRSPGDRYDLRRGEAVVVRDEHGAARLPHSSKAQPQRWWGIFRGTGLFIVEVEGLPEPFRFHVQRPGS